MTPVDLAAVHVPRQNPTARELADERELMASIAPFESSVVAVMALAAQPNFSRARLARHAKVALRALRRLASAAECAAEHE